MMKAKYVFTSLLAVIGVVGGLVLPLAGCGGGGSRDDEASTYRLGDSVTLKVGDSLVVDSNVSGDPVRLVISEVSQDSRCPEGSSCGGPGAVGIAASLSGAGAAVETFTIFDLTPPMDLSASGNRSAYRVDVTAVKPGVRAGKQIAQSDYRMTVTIERVP